MATQVFISFDTEFSALLQQRGVPARANFKSSILGRCSAGDFGIVAQMDMLDTHGLKGIFFVDPMPGLVHGRTILSDVVGPIVARGHDVQLHIHTEWLAFAEEQPVGDARGRNIADFSLAEQIRLLELARDMLIEAGAPSPTAFRAGNYGANDDTLRALAHLGFLWDSSLNPVYLGDGCAIDLPRTIVHATQHLGLTEVPVATLHDRPGHLRPAQVCALSAWEMKAALDFAARHAHRHFMIVCHSFEMLSRDRARPNYMVIDRFEQLCRHIATHPDLDTATFQTIAPVDAVSRQERHLGPNLLRTAHRMAEQALSHWQYERA
jgi:peptidoglycan/xylan/chitin deacetylase (PgdA/CDA1 family)